MGGSISIKLGVSLFLDRDLDFFFFFLIDASLGSVYSRFSSALVSVISSSLSSNITPLFFFSFKVVSEDVERNEYRRGGGVNLYGTSEYIPVDVDKGTG
jgi:hypothetical protein